MSGAATAEYSLGTANYWDDDQIARLLDQNRIDIYQEELGRFPKTLAGGTLSWLEYRSRHGNFEQTSGGTSVFVVETATGTDAGTADWSADYRRGIVTFNADQGGTIYFLTGRAYDLNGAAADLLEAWAAWASTKFDFVEDGQSFKRSQRAILLSRAAKEFRRKMRAISIAQVRDDC